jgi:hypothetical protein
MELVSIENARVTDLFTAQRSQGQPYAPHVIAAFVERYKFVGYPTKLEDFTGTVIAFKHGVFNDCAIETFDVYSDGVIAASKSASDVLDSFLADVYGWIEVAMGMKRLQTHAIHKGYESHIVVYSPAPIFKPLEALHSVQSIVSRALKASGGHEVKFHPIGFGIAPDTSQIAELRPIPFRIERRAGVSFDTNLYYSSAPLPTSEHLKVLDRWEKSL